MFDKLKDKLNLNLNVLINFIDNFENYYNSEDYYSDTDIDVFIRDLKLKLILENYDISPKIENLDKDTIDICRKLSEKGMVIGGSVVLIACGLLSRKNNDIDVFWDIERALKEKIITKNNIINKSDSYMDDVVRYKIRLDDDETVLDIFQVKINNSTKIDGINFDDPIKTLEIKLGYYRQKDMDDFKIIKQKLNMD